MRQPKATSKSKKLKSLCGAIVMLSGVVIGAGVTAESQSAGAISMINTQQAISASRTARRPINTLKVMNYYPSSTPWTSWWTSYNHNAVYNDFYHIAAMGANTVRIIVSPQALGWPTPTAAGAAELNDAITAAGALGLSVQLTLFDWFSGYDQVANSLKWMTALLAPYKNDNRIVLVEPQNELPISNPLAVTWAQSMLSALPSLLPGVPRVLSVSGDQGVAEMGTVNQMFPPSMLDAVDTHLYGSESSIATKIAAAESVAQGRPVFAGEFGLATDATDSACSQAAQLSFYQRISILLDQNGISALAPWTYNDSTIGSLRATNAPASESFYGLRKVDGSYKPAAGPVATMFANPDAASRLAAASAVSLGNAISFDGGFECDLQSPSDNTGNDAWTVSDSSDAGGAGVAGGMGVNGSTAGYLSATAGNPNIKIPSLMHLLPVLANRPITATALTRLVNATGSTRLSLSWFNGSQYLGHSQSIPATNSSTGWQQLSVTATPPAGATTFGLYLASAMNSGTAYFDSVTVQS